jgi:hypothetical protein
MGQDVSSLDANKGGQIISSAKKKKKKKDITF